MNAGEISADDNVIKLSTLNHLSSHFDTTLNKGFCFVPEIPFSLFVKQTLIYITSFSFCATMPFGKCSAADCYTDTRLYMSAHMHMGTYSF